MSKSADLKVFITTREATCDECGEAFGRRAWITLKEEEGALCLAAGEDRWAARERVSDQVERLLSQWET